MKSRSLISQSVHQPWQSDANDAQKSPKREEGLPRSKNPETKTIHRELFRSSYCYISNILMRWHTVVWQVVNSNSAWAFFLPTEVHTSCSRLRSHLSQLHLKVKDGYNVTLKTRSFIITELALMVAHWVIDIILGLIRIIYSSVLNRYTLILFSNKFNIEIYKLS